ncbi:MAG: hypothetical protein GY699_22575 [Desulfobacteraceae bacterium]|nr:hypothetical protein [Desulfobacteraceae bacterium]
MTPKKYPEVCLKIQMDETAIFSSILQQGIKISVMTECNIKQMLCDQFGVAPDYLSDRISTIFLDGKPVDNVETAQIKDGATLALSGAMPGLVGATFRKGGALSIFRSSITHENDTDQINMSAKGMITIKLFNLLISEIGPVFINKGFWLKKKEMQDFIKSKKDDFPDVFKSIHFNEHKTGLVIEELLKKYDSQQLFRIMVS